MTSSFEILPAASPSFLAALAVLVVVAYLSVRFGFGPANSLAKRWGLLLLRVVLVCVLLVLLTNPVSVQELPSVSEPAEVFYLLDSSESMGVGSGETTRWDQAIQRVSDSIPGDVESPPARISLFKFGRRLEAIGDPRTLGLQASSAASGPVQFTTKQEADAVGSVPVPRMAASEPDTQLLVALRQISSRFGREPPASIVLFSDGRARDEKHVEEVAKHFAALGVPIHVVPMGETGRGGDVSIISVVVPPSVRKQSRVDAQIFLRSYGFDGRRAEVQLNMVDEQGRFLRKLDSKSATLQSGFQSESLSFQSDLAMRSLQATVETQPNEISVENNRFDTELVVDRTKIRVLYLEGSSSSAQAHTDLQAALQADPDVECAVLSVQGANVRVVSGHFAAFPRTAAELSAYDAVILSDVSSQPFDENRMRWLESWISRRGGGLCMVGGRSSFASGGWKGTAMERMLPVQMVGETDWHSSLPVTVRANTSNRLHPLFRILEDDAQNRQLLETFPSFRGANLHLRPKPGFTTVLAVGTGGGSMPTGKLFTFAGIQSLLSSATDAAVAEEEEFPLVTVGQYGKGRTMAVSVPITGASAQPFRTWGKRGSEYYSKFWRNAVYWVTEGSFIGRRRLVAFANKRYYRPGEAIGVDAVSYDESGNNTTEYKILGMIEPESFDNIESDYSPVRWPDDVERTSGLEGPFIAWGEEFELPLKPAGGKREAHQIELAIADALSMGSSNQTLRLELTAYEDFTQVDSTSVAIQVLHDPFEQQNPFPNHELLHELAEKSGGQVLENADDIMQQLTDLPVTKGLSEVRKTPVWSRWWLLVALLGVLSAEWCWRRGIGLA